VVEDPDAVESEVLGPPREILKERGRRRWLAGVHGGRQEHPEAKPGSHDHGSVI